MSRDTSLDGLTFTRLFGDPKRAWLILQLAEAAGFRFHPSNDRLRVVLPHDGTMPRPLKNLLKFWVILNAAAIAELLATEGAP